MDPHPPDAKGSDTDTSPTPPITPLTPTITPPTPATTPPKSHRPTSPTFDESGSVNNTHTLSSSHHKHVQHINITLDASPARSPSASPMLSRSLSPSMQRSRSDSFDENATPTRAPSTPPPQPSSSSNLGTQIQSAFARLSTLASESLKTSTSDKGSPENNSAPFWKRKGKFPGSVKPVNKDSYKPHGFMARPPTPPKDYDDPSPYSSSSSTTTSSTSSSFSDFSTIQKSSTNGFNKDPHDHPHKSEGSEWEHHCLEFKSCGSSSEQSSRLEKFKKILGENVVDLEALKKTCWTGVPGEVRPQCWRLLLGYLPANADRRESTLQRKRKEYFDCIPQYFDIPDTERTEAERKILHQIQIDVPRTNPNVLLFQQPAVQQLLERILYIWAIRHPASGYVQGINDLATPFFVVFLTEIADSIDTVEVSTLPPEKLRDVEADSYWCMSKLLDGIQDHYTFAQPGIQRMTYKLKELVGRIDAPLSKHLAEQDAQFIQFAFRWMNCFLMREIPLPLIARMWDTYLAEGPTGGFGVFHAYVCAAFLVSWSEELRQREFQDIMLFLQHLPTTRWHCKDVELLLSQAFIWMSIFHNAPSHLKS